jgi:hypothetical protein
VRAVKVLLASLRSTLTPAPYARMRSLRFHTKKFVAAENEANGSPRTKLLRLLNKVSRPFYTPRRDSGPPLDSWARSSTNASTVDDFAARASVDWRSDSPDLHKPWESTLNNRRNGDVLAQPLAQTHVHGLDHASSRKSHAPDFQSGGFTQAMLIIRSEYLISCQICPVGHSLQQGIVCRGRVSLYKSAKMLRAAKRLDHSSIVDSIRLMLL